MLHTSSIFRILRQHKKRCSQQLTVEPHLFFHMHGISFASHYGPWLSSSYFRCSLYCDWCDSQNFFLIESVLLLSWSRSRSLLEACIQPWSIWSQCWSNMWPAGEARLKQRYLTEVFVASYVAIVRYDDYSCILSHRTRSSHITALLCYDGRTYCTTSISV